ncbi:MAG: hypothetical protein K6B75_07290 [Lachnospiraceae bacterium]|nr:hypothetical protein [Lachnospiraceae bacterium]
MNKSGVTGKFKAGVGNDAGLFAVRENEYEKVSVATVCGNEKGVALLAFARACNSLAASFGKPEYAALSLTFPENTKEDIIKETLDEAVFAAKKAGVKIVSGNTITAGVMETVVTVTAFGNEVSPMAPEAAVAVCPDEGTTNYLMMAGFAGCAGTSMLAREYKEEIHARYTYEFIEKAEKMCEDIFTAGAAQILAGNGITLMHDVSEGGVFGAIWELLERLSLGAEIKLPLIPIRQETVEITEFFDVNPYQLRGDGGLVFICSNPDEIKEDLKEAGFFAETIGLITAGNDRVLVNGEDKRYLEPNRTDDYYVAKGGRRRTE